MRGVLWLLIAMLIFAPFNIVTIWQLLRTHPRARHWIVTAAVAGNLMWPFFLMLRQLTPFTRCPSRVFLTLGLIGSIAGVYHALVPLRVERVPVAIDGLPASAEGMRLALLSDLHVGLFTRPGRLARIFETTSRLGPDAVLMAGDLIDDDPHFVPKLLEGTRSLDPAIPLLAVLGNHEMYDDPLRVIAALRGSRVRLLVNEGAALGPLWIGGISDYAAETRSLAPDAERALAAAGSATRILLSHQPRDSPRPVTGNGEPETGISSSVTGFRFPVSGYRQCTC
ncbi:MAG TPA: metallophosphoesterase [Thermoanaerobaculia bacterium]|nr:metallophosphoesterase [Thermoanaerobaculia bacterium]